MRLEPLQEYICDTCEEKINSINDGYVEFLKDNETKEFYEFNIVHNKPSSPLQGIAKCFQHDADPARRDLPLSSFFGADNFNRLFSFLDAGEIIDPDNNGNRVRDIREYVELMRRLTIPNYEEARQFISNANEDGLFDGANEVSIYTQNKLQEIIDRYSR